MIQLSGPTYRYSGEVLTKPEIIYVNDHHYNEQDQCFHIKQLLDNSTCNPLDHQVVLDHVLVHDDELKNYNLICYPALLAKEEKEFVNQHIEPDWHSRSKTFNFMINKPRLHREFLLLLIDYFELNNYAHTLCWKNSSVSKSTLSKLTEKYQSLVSTTAVTVEPKNFLLGQEHLLDRGLQYRHIKNCENYQSFLQKEVFEPTCISVITEPAFFEKESILTEKTIMSIYSGTLPIWVGGWRCADALRKFGFDVFDDVIDHSYQNMEDPFDRCYYAVERNLDLLQDFDRANNFVQNNHSRFEHNLQLLKNNVFQQAVDKINTLVLSNNN